MPIDSSIYFKQQAPDIMGGIERGLKLGDMLKKGKTAAAVKEAYKMAQVTDDDGNITLDQPTLMSGLAKASPEAFEKYKTGLATQEQQRQANMLGQAKLGLRPVVGPQGRTTGFEPDPNNPNYSAQIAQALNLGKLNQLQRQGDLGTRKMNLQETKAKYDTLIKSGFRPKGLDASGNPTGWYRPRGTMKKKTYKADQYKAGGFAMRAQQGNQLLENLINKGFDPTSLSTDYQSRFMPDFMEGMKTDDVKTYEQAKNNFISAILRRESGAAISVDEFEKESKKYFPQSGDSAQTLKAKKAARAQATTNLRVEAGGAYDQIKSQSAPLESGFAPKSNNQTKKPSWAE